MITPQAIIMTETDIAYVKWCIEHDIHKFYTWVKWEHKRKEILESDHYECQHCKAQGIYRRATTVHHMQYVRKHPECALEDFYVWNGEKRRNLVSLCNACHEAAHGYRRKTVRPITLERW